MHNRLIITANMCVAYAHQWSSSGAVLYIKALSWRHHDFAVCSSKCRAMVRTLLRLKVYAFLAIPPRQMKMPLQCSGALRAVLSSTVLCLALRIF